MLNEEATVLPFKPKHACEFITDVITYPSGTGLWEQTAIGETGTSIVNVALVGSHVTVLRHSLVVHTLVTTHPAGRGLSMQTTGSGFAGVLTNSVWNEELGPPVGCPGHPDD
jgi:hypothetical protein